MDLNEFAARAATTDVTEDDQQGFHVVLHGLAGEAGSVVSEAKKWFRDKGPTGGFKDRVEEELGDLLWYLAAVATRLGLDLNTVAAKNLSKAQETFLDQLPLPATYDIGWPELQRLPRVFDVRFEEDSSSQVPRVRMIALGEVGERVQRERERKQLGAALDDNLDIDDGYRYHDVIHLAHAAVLGWSPVLRSLLGAKRKGPPPAGIESDVDRTQDGARAIAIEEGLSAFVFNFLEPDGFDGVDDLLTRDLIKHVQRSVRGLEVESQPLVAWRRAYSQAFACLARLREDGGGLVHVDLDAQTVAVAS